MQRKIVGLLLTGAALFFAWNCCGANEESKSAARVSFYGNEEAAAAAMLQEFVKTGEKDAALSNRLRPTEADYRAVFEPEFAQKLFAAYDPAWNAGQFVIAPKSKETTIKLFSATSDELKTWTGNATGFSEGWKQVAPKLKSNLKIYGFKFVEPGSDFGTVYEGLVYVNGNWRIFPKPWRAMD